MKESLKVLASPGEVFRLTQDYALRRRWDPFTGSMRFLDGATESGPGVRVAFRARNGLAMVVRIMVFQPPERVAMEMERGPPFFERFAGAWSFKELSADRTEVAFNYGFATRPRWLQGVMEPSVAWALRRDVRARLAGLKRAVEIDHLLEELEPG